MKSIVISSWQAARKVREKNKQIVERVRGKGDDVNYWRNIQRVIYGRLVGEDTRTRTWKVTSILKPSTHATPSLTP